MGGRWLPVLLLAALLGAQAIQADHAHADHLLAQDCVQCKLDNSHAVLPERVGSGTILIQAAESRLAVPAAPVSIHYRRAARGPPHNFC